MKRLMLVNLNNLWLQPYTISLSSSKCFSLHAPDGAEWTHCMTGKKGKISALSVFWIAGKHSAGMMHFRFLLINHPLLGARRVYKGHPLTGKVSNALQPPFYTGCVSAAVRLQCISIPSEAIHQFTLDVFVVRN